MPKNYCANRGCCPELILICPDANQYPGRTFLCVRCNVRVIICSCCDHGQIYCGSGCSRIARQTAQHEAGRRYQQSRDGRFAHAERNRRYRVRLKNVTHQASLSPASGGLMASDPTTIACGALPPSLRQERSLSDSGGQWRCHFCGRCCPLFVRQGFLRRRRVPRRQSRHAQRGYDNRGITP